MKMNVRDASSNDGAKLTELALNSKSHWPYSSEYLENCRKPLFINEEYIKCNHVMILEYNNVFAGFNALTFDDGQLYLDHLWLAPNFIGKGFGALLFTNAVQKTKELKQDHFFIVADPFALKFYLKMGSKLEGFIESKVRPHLFLPLLKYTLLK